ncbi:hypothetical protein BG842_00100 [Haladaptatus sp. W1]|uniref:DUF7344 domain-containing protein n=1 Tax=Haladaptatus sp. W1 TaxID=1897478 RepID=UPI000849C34C|nr:hypothetical protein [Haladaptatus sp. W1]ODR81177.1 hypothetical protein BG842_00100 [Haladaptatus sp. W1]
MSVSSDSTAGDGFEHATEESVEPLSRDKIFHILQTQRRRDALRFLKETGGTVEMRDLAEQVAAWENDTTVQALTSDERQRVYIALYQSHLPKLESEGIIRYNKSRGIVERGPLADQFDPYLDTANESAYEVETKESESSDDEIPWLRYYRVATVVGIAVVAAAWLGVPPVSFVPNLIWDVLIVASFTALSLAQLLTDDE